MPTRPRAFTLIELLAVISITAVLAVLASTAVSSARAATQRTKCTANLARIANGIRQFANDNNGAIPPGWNGSRPYVWQYDVAPYLEIERTNTHGAHGTVWQCPSVPTNELPANAATYALNQYLVYSAAEPVKYFQKMEKPSRTVLVGDNSAINTDQLQAITYNGGQGTVVFRHPNKVTGNPAAVKKGPLNYKGEGMANVAFADGHVESLKPAELAQGGKNNVIWQP